MGGWSEQQIVNFAILCFAIPIAIETVEARKVLYDELVSLFALEEISKARTMKPMRAEAHYKRLAGFVRTHNHDLTHGLYSVGRVVDLTDEAAGALEIFSKITARYFGVSMDVAESACINTCLKYFAMFLALYGKNGIERRLAGARSIKSRWSPGNADSNQAGGILLPESGVCLKAEAEASMDDMVLLTRIKTLKPGAWTWPKVQYQRFKMLFPNREPEEKKVVAQSPVTAETIDAGEREAIQQCVKLFQREGRASTTMLQNKLGFTYKKSTRLMKKLEKLGAIGPSNGKDSRAILKLP